MAKRQISNTLRDKFLFEAGLTLNQIKIKHRLPDSTVEETTEIFQGALYGDMKILYPMPNGTLKRHNGKNEQEITYRLRKAIPFIDKNNKENKYRMHGNICIFFPPEMLKAYKQETAIDTLILTEGEKKAFVACKYGFDCLGISGIWCYKTKDDIADMTQGELLPELKDFLKVCKVKRVVLLHDSDSLDITDTNKSSDKKKSETDRPTLFCNSVKRCAELIFQEGMKFYFSYINPHLCDKNEKLGLDDLLLKYERLDIRPTNEVTTQPVLHDFYKSIEQGKHSSYFCTFHITYIMPVFFKEIWKLNDPQEFYLYHKQKLAGKEVFLFEGRRFKINNTEGKIEEIKNTDRNEFFEKDGRYYGYDLKGNMKCFSDFTMCVHFLLKSPKMPKRIVSFKNVLGQEFVAELTMDDFVSVSNFRKKVMAHGTFTFKGEIYELLNLQQVLFADEQVAVELNSLGWQKNYGFWAWSNGITQDGKFFPADEFGIVTYKESKYYLPAFSTLNKSIEDDFENERKFMHMPESEISLAEWMNTFCGAYGDNGMVAALFYIASLYRDIIFPHLKAFPILNLFGQKGSGKGTMARSLMCMYGIPQSEQNLEAGASTIKSIYRKQAQFVNALVWIDEYKNSISMRDIGQIKSLYDGVGYSRAQTSQDYKTTNIPVRSSTVLSGQDMPTADPALFSRVILLMLEKNKFSVDARALIEKLNEYEKNGLTSITNYLIGFREVIKERFKDEYKYWRGKLSAAFEYKSAPDRMINNAAAILAPASILIDCKVFQGNNGLNFTRQGIYQRVYDVFDKHVRLINDNQEISVFWETVEALYEEGLVSAEKGHFRFKDDLLVIRYNTLYNAYAIKFRQVTNRVGIEKQTLLNYLKSSAAFHSHMDKVRFGENNTTSGYAFRYKELGITLGSDNSPESALESLTAPYLTVPAEEEDLPFK